MRFGVIARAEDRGLGIQTWEVCRHLEPDRVIIVDMGPLARNWRQHLDRYDAWDPHVVRYDRMGDPATMLPLLKGLDVVYFAETPYDWRLCELAERVGCATVCHLNPEFHEPENPYRPTQYWLPSRWLRYDPRLPADAHLVRMPCPTDRWSGEPEPYDGDRPLRVLHVGGKAAMADRNGTRSLLIALRGVKADVEVTVTTQDSHLPSPSRLPPNVRYKIKRVADYWQLYENQDVLVLPRRYGGLCLPAIEAAGAGLALVMTDCDPNDTDYPAVLAECTESEPIVTKLGFVPTFTAEPFALARAIDALADKNVLQAQQRVSENWAKDHAWDQWARMWRSHLANAVR